jgi:hypothetical protein
VQQPSSLIFLVIIAVWAVYFVQYWVRRREHLATARSVDQFSESLRVLERRTPTTTSPRASYAGSPARAVRPQVHAQAVSKAAAPVTSVPVVEPARPVASAAGARPSRRTRGRTLLVALVAVPLAAVAAAVGVLPAWTPVLPVLGVVSCVAWLRAAVRTERAARAAARAARPRRTASPTSAHTAVHAPAHPRAARPVPSRTVTPPAPFAPSVAPAAEVAAEVVEQGPVATVPAEELFDGWALEAAHRPAVDEPGSPAFLQPLLHHLVDEDDIPLTWDPVPVPPPTYTMKARVTRPAPASADLVGDADTEYAEAFEAAGTVRRVAGA